MLAASTRGFCLTAPRTRGVPRWLAQGHALLPSTSSTSLSPTPSPKPMKSRRQLSILAAQILPSSTPGTQTYLLGTEAVDVPVAAVQQLPEPLQAAVVAAIFASLSLSTWALLSLSDMSWAHSPAQTWILGTTFTLAGVAHFATHDAFCSMMPTKGAWGIWYLPGSDSFHVNWTGVAEAAGGLGLLLSNIPAVHEAAPWLSNASALGLFALAVAVTPSNIFMFTHNAPGPGPKGAVIPATGHAARGVLQVLLWAVLWDLAHQ